MIVIILDEEQDACLTKNKEKKSGYMKRERKRETEGDFATLYEELINDETKIFQYLRMSKNCLMTLLSDVWCGVVWCGVL